MKLIGLTGGIASGKTMITDYLEEIGEYVIDVDVINRNLLSNCVDVQKALVEIAPEAAKRYVDFGGREQYEVDRKKLAEIIFNDHQIRRKIEQVVKPHIEDAVNLEIITAAQANRKLVFYSHPLLMTSFQWERCHRIINIWCDEKLQVERLVARNKLTEEEAKNRIKVQKQPIEWTYESGILVDYVQNEHKSTALSSITKLVADYHIKY